MKINIKHPLLIIAAVLGSSFCLPVFLQAKPISLMGSWKAYFQGQDDDTAADGLVQFRQLYNASWTPLISRNMTLSSNIGYSHNWFEDLGTRELISPSMQLNVKNDLFNLSLNGNVLKKNISFRESIQTYNWNSNIASSWTNYLWPQLTLRMGQRYQETGGTASHTVVDSIYSYVGTSVSWKTEKVKLFYDYNRSKEDNEYLSDTTQQNEEGHLAKFEYNDSFWSNRVSLNFSQLFYASTLEQSTDGNNALLRVPVSSSYSGVDVTPASGSLSLNQALIDGNQTSPAVTIQLQQPMNIGLRTSFNSIDRLYVYTTKDDKLLVANTAAITWDLYISNDSVNWQLAAGNVASTFNSTEFRFEVVTDSVQAEYIKLVATGWIPAIDLDITELEVYTILRADSSGTVDRDSKNYKTEFYLGVTPLDSTKFNYTFSWDRTESSGVSESVVDQIIQTARLNWDYSRYFSPSAGFSSIVNTNDRAAATDTETRSFDLQVRSSPISTIDLGLTCSWTEFFEDDVRDRSVKHISLSALTALYPDLSSEISVGFNQAESDITDEQTESVFISFLMHSRLRKTLNLDFQTRYSIGESDTLVLLPGHLGHGSSILENASNEGGEAILTVNWRPSDILSFSLRGFTTFGDNVESQSGGAFNTNYLIFRSSKTNLTLSYWLNASSNNDTVNNFGLIWGWDLSTHFILHTSGNYVITEDEKTWNFYSQLTTKF